MAFRLRHLSTEALAKVEGFGGQAAIAIQIYFLTFIQNGYI
jgi:hypothetical protein